MQCICFIYIYTVDALYISESQMYVECSVDTYMQSVYTIVDAFVYLQRICSVDTTVYVV
jgi:hypothetical protein